MNKVISREYVEKNYIHKDKVRNKINELIQAYEDSKDEYGESEYYFPDYTIQKLEELLEGTEDANKQ